MTTSAVFNSACDAKGEWHIEPSVRRAMKAFVRASMKGAAVEIVIRKKRARKSQEQLGWYWGCILPALAELTGYTVEELHAYCTRKFLDPPERKTLVIVDADGAVVEEADVQLYPDRVRLLNTGQMADFCDNIRAWAAADLHIDIPDPDPKWRDHARAA